MASPYSRLCAVQRDVALAGRHDAVLSQMRACYMMYSTYEHVETCLAVAVHFLRHAPNCSSAVDSPRCCLPAIQTRPSRNHSDAFCCFVPSYHEAIAKMTKQWAQSCTHRISSVPRLGHPVSAVTGPCSRSRKPQTKGSSTPGPLLMLPLQNSQPSSPTTITRAACTPRTAPAAPRCRTRRAAARPPRSETPRRPCRAGRWRGRRACTCPAPRP